MNDAHPMDALLKTDRIPHIWCPGCGVGTVLQCLLNSIAKSGFDQEKVSVVSGIGCTGRGSGYVNFDSFHTTHGRAIPFATGLKLANPDLKVIVFSGDGDLTAIGGNHFIHAARRNIDITVICVNNFNYGMTGGQLAPTTPLGGRTSTSPHGNTEHPFSIPYLAAATGAVYVARWTSLHVRQLERSMIEAIHKTGFSVVEVLSPCPTLFGAMNKQRTGLEQLKHYRENCVIKHGANPQEVDIGLTGPIVVGKFVDIEKPSFLELRERETAAHSS